MVQVTHVEDDEALYRSVPSNGAEIGLFTVRDDGTLDRFSPQAFSDRAHRTSVDRALLRDDPKDTCKQPNAGVTRVITGDVRAIGPLPVNDHKGKSIGQACVDVKHTPIEDDPNEPDNQAHAEIFVEPDSTNRYKRLIESLAFLANHQGWIVEPSKT